MYGYGDYGYGYGYGAGAGATAVLMLIAVIAAIVFTVIGYRRYVRVPGQRLVSMSDKSTWGPFLRFDTLLIERILKVLYIFNLVLIPLTALAGVIGAFFGGFGAGIAALVGAIVYVVIAEVIVRLVFEGIMLNVVIARNTSDIKRAMGVGDPMDADGISSPAPSAGEYAAASYVAPTYTSAPAASATPTCPTCGAPVKADSAFCGSCGTRLK